jgi:hypothetical protein
MQGQAKAADEAVGGFVGQALQAVEQSLIASLQTGLGQEFAGVGAVPGKCIEYV